MGWIIGGVIFIVLALMCWCLCRTSSMSSRRDEELEELEELARLHESE